MLLCINTKFPFRFSHLSYYITGNTTRELTNILTLVFYGIPYDIDFNALNPELNPICYLLTLLAHHFLHVSRIRVKSLTLRLLMSYINGAPILDVSRSHTKTQHSR